MKVKDFTEIRKILDILPHGEEVLRVDRIVELIPGKKAVGETIFDRNSFSGHFPKIQFAPLPVLLEVAHQVGQIAICSEPNVKEMIDSGFLPEGTGIDEIKKIKCKVFPEKKFVVEAWIDRPYKGPFHLGHVSWKSWCNGKEQMEGGFKYTFQKVDDILREKEEN